MRLQRGDAARAIKQAETFEVFKRGRSILSYLSARAYLLGHQAPQSLADWDRLGQLSAAGFWKTIATVGRARAAAQAGDAAAARTAYEQALKHLAAADQDVPLLAEIKGEYSTLK
jgi:hypothetical protein